MRKMWVLLLSKKKGSEAEEPASACLCQLLVSLVTPNGYLTSNEQWSKASIMVPTLGSPLA